MTPKLPYVIYGIVYTEDGSTVIPNQKLKFTNETTGESISIYANSNGVYVFDCANFELEYIDGDRIKIELESELSSSDYESYVSIDGGITWQYIQNNATYYPSANKARLIVDTNKGGVTGFDITDSS